MSTVFQSSNEFGEKQNNTMTTEQVTSLSEVLAFPEIAAESIMVNPEAEADFPVAKTFQEVSDLLPSKTGVTALTASAVTDAVVTAVADAPVAAALYTQADIQAMVDLVNDLKAKYNLAVALINDLKSKHNAFLAAAKVVS